MAAQLLQLVALQVLLALTAAATSSSPVAGDAAASAGGVPPSWLNFKHEGALVAGGGRYESTPMHLGGKLYLMQSMMGQFAPDGGAHSYFCVFDGATGEEITCPPSSSGHAACSGIVDRSTDRAYVFCSAWDRANHTSCPTPAKGSFSWGCGACSRPGECYVGAWWSDDMRSWHGPSMAIPPDQVAKLRKPAYGPGHPPLHPPKLQLPTNVAAAPVPAWTAARIPGVPQHQAFMAFELSYNIAVNVGTDGDLSTNWIVLDPSKFGGQGIECPAVRYRPKDGYYYLFGDIESVGQIFLKRTKNLTVGSWESPPHNRVVMESGCINRTLAGQYAGRFKELLAPSEDCSAGQNMTRIAPGYFTEYWKNETDRVCCDSHGHVEGLARSYLTNLSSWQWSVNDPDFCDSGGKAPTYFIYGMCAQTHPSNWTGRVADFYQLGIFNGTDVDFLASYFEYDDDELPVMPTARFKSDDSAAAAAAAGVTALQQKNRTMTGSKVVPSTATPDVMLWWAMGGNELSLNQTREAAANISLSKFGKQPGEDHGGAAAAVRPSLAFSPFERAGGKFAFMVSTRPGSVPVVGKTVPPACPPTCPLQNITGNFASLHVLRRFGPIIPAISLNQPGPGPGPRGASRSDGCVADTNRTCADWMAGFLANTTRRATAVRELVDLAHREGFGGYNFDQEYTLKLLPAPQQASFTANWRRFLTELSGAMRAQNPQALVSVDIVGGTAQDYMGMTPDKWRATGCEAVSMGTYGNNYSVMDSYKNGSIFNKKQQRLLDLATGIGAGGARVGLGQGVPEWLPRSSQRDLDELQAQLAAVRRAKLQKLAVFIAPSIYTSVEWLNTIYDWVAEQKEDRVYALDLSALKSVSLKVDDRAAAVAGGGRKFMNESIVDVLDFGAKGDGVTDDTAAIQAALDAGVGKLVYFPHTGRSETMQAAYIISATLETDKNGPVSIMGGAGTEESVFIVWNGPPDGTMLRWNSGWGRMTGINFYSGSALPGIVMHVGYNPSRTSVVSIEDVEFEHCVFGGGEYRVANHSVLSGGGRIAGVMLGSFFINGLDDDIAVVKFRHCRFDSNFDGVVWQSANALNIDFDSCAWHKARDDPDHQRRDHDVRSHVRMIRGGCASFTNPYFGDLGFSGLADAAIHIWSGWVSVTKAECESSTGGGGFLWMENNTVSAEPIVGTTPIHEVMRPSVITGSRILAKAVFGKGAPIVMSPGASPIVLVGNWMNYRIEAEFGGPWVLMEPGASTSFVTSIGNTFWSTRASPFDIQVSAGSVGGRLISSGDLVTADYGRTLRPLAAISSHVLAVTTSPFVIGGSFDDFHVTTAASRAAAFNVTLPPAALQWGRKLTVTHVSGATPLTLHAAAADGIVGQPQFELPRIFDSVTLQSDGGQQWLVLGKSVISDSLPMKNDDPDVSGRGNALQKVRHGPCRQSPSHGRKQPMAPVIRSDANRRRHHTDGWAYGAPCIGEDETELCCAMELCCGRDNHGTQCGGDAGCSGGAAAVGESIVKRTRGAAHGVSMGIKSDDDGGGGPAACWFINASATDAGIRDWQLPRFINHSVHTVIHTAHWVCSPVTARQQSPQSVGGTKPPPLLLMLPGTGLAPLDYTLFPRHAASLGMPAIGLAYPTNMAATSACMKVDPSQNCYDGYHESLLEYRGPEYDSNFTWKGSGSFNALKPKDTIAHRLVALLQTLHNAEPRLGWDRFITANTTIANGAAAINWSEIIVAGHSQGACHVGWVSKRFSLQRGIMFSGTNDITGSKTGWPGPSPAPYLKEPGATPAGRLFGFGELNGGECGTWRPLWDTMNLTGPFLVDEGKGGADGAAPETIVPAAHMLCSNRSTADGGVHGGPVQDVATPRGTGGEPIYAPVWTYLLTAPTTDSAGTTLSVLAGSSSSMSSSSPAAAVRVGVARGLKLQPNASNCECSHPLPLPASLV